MKEGAAPITDSGLDLWREDEDCKEIITATKFFI